MEKKVSVIGVGGRTGTMFAFELGKAANVKGVARKKEVVLVRENRLYIKNSDGGETLFKEEMVEDTDFNENLCPDIFLLATRNPISNPLKFYLSCCKDKKPTFIISQNGIEAIKDAQRAILEVMGGEKEKIRLVRVILFNPVDKKRFEDWICIQYSLPIKGAFAKVMGPGDAEDIAVLFEKSGFQFEQFPSSEARNIEFSKLFLNLIGMASASRGLSIRKGFLDKKIFEEEVKALKEYVTVVHKSGGRFLNFNAYNVGDYALVVGKTPLWIISLFRKKITEIITKGREGKPKVLDEIDYYNGAVVKLGKEVGVETPINQEIWKRAKERINSQQ